MLTVIATTALIISGFLQLVRNVAKVKMQIWITKQLSAEVFNMSFFIAIKNSGAVGSQYIRDFDKVKNFLSSNEFINLLDIPWSVIFIIVLFLIHPLIGLLVLTGLIISGAVAFTAYYITSKMEDALNKINIEKMRFVEQSVRNSEALLAMNMNEGVCSVLNEMDEMHIKQLKKTKYYADSLGQITNFIKSFMSVAVLGLGAILVLNNQITSGAIIASSAIAGRSLVPLHTLLQNLSNIADFKESFERLNSSFRYFNLEGESMKLPEPVGKLAFQAVSYAMDKKSKPIVRNISFELNAGEILAIIGPTGGGKSTIARLACGVWEATSGTVRIDDADIKHWSNFGAGKYIGYLPQDAQLFKGTIKENIGKMGKEIDADEVIIAAQKAGLHEIILKMPKGYDTEIGYDGDNLSAGMKQRIGLARALFGYPKYIILDEPNSNLDIQGEQELENALRIAKEEKITTIIVSHKQPILRLVDKIMIVLNGQIADFGARDEMIKKHLVNKA